MTEGEALHGDPDKPTDSLAAWQRVLDRRREHFADRGTAYVTLVVPASAGQPGVPQTAGAPDSKSPFERLDELLDDETRAQCAYPLEQLREGQAERPTYVAGESRLTDWGDYVCYLAAMDCLQSQGAGVEILGADQVEWDGSATVAGSRSETVRRIATERHEEYLVVEQDRPELPTAVVFRDSSVSDTSKFFAESFRRVVSVTHSGTMYFDMLDAEKPDVVVFELAETRLSTAPTEPSLLDARMVFGDLLLDEQQAVMAQLDSRAKATAGDLVGALADNDRALELSKPTARLLVYRARLLRALGKVDAGMEALRTAASLDPTDAPVHYLLAAAMLAKQQPATALEEARTAAQLEPRHIEFWTLAVSAAIGLQDAELALSVAREAVQHHDDDTRAHAALSQALATTGNLDEAEVEARRALELQESTYVLGVLASILIRRNELIAARDCLKRLRELDPQSPQVQTYLTMVEQKLATT